MLAKVISAHHTLFGYCDRRGIFGTNCFADQGARTFVTNGLSGGSTCYHSTDHLSLCYSWSLNGRFFNRFVTTFSPKSYIPLILQTQRSL